MRIAVVGAGAVGSVLGGCLAAGGHGVVLVGRTGPQRPIGGTLELWGPGNRRRSVPVTRVASSAGLPQDLDAAILAVKRFDLPGAVDVLRDLPGLPAVTVQNGIGAEELLLTRRPGSGLIAASLTAAVELGAGGEARWLRRGGIGLAPVDGDVEAVAVALADAFRAGGMPAVRMRDAASMKWSKLLTNLVGNATSALLDLDVGAIYADPQLYEIERRQLLEALAVMGALGQRPVALPGADVPLLVRVLRAPPVLGRPILARVLGGVRGGKMPSLRLALRAGPGPTEVAWLNGAVADAAARAGIPAPVNAALWRLVEDAAEDPARRAWFVGRPERLVAALVASTAL